MMVLGRGRGYGNGPRLIKSGIRCMHGNGVKCIEGKILDRSCLRTRRLYHC